MILYFEFMIQRELKSLIEERFSDHKAIILLGARQTGKTTLLDEFVKNKEKVMWLNADEADVRELFKTASSSRFNSLFKQYEILVVDEAQRISDVGLKLKMIVDNIRAPLKTSFSFPIPFLELF